MSDEQGGNATPSPQASVAPDALVGVPTGADQPPTPPAASADGWPAPRLVDHEYKDNSPHQTFAHREE
jgi:hypothetical protein